MGAAPVTIYFNPSGVFTSGDARKWLREMLYDVNNYRIGAPITQTNIATAGINVS